MQVDFMYICTVIMCSKKKKSFSCCVLDASFPPQCHLEGMECWELARWVILQCNPLTICTREEGQLFGNIQGWIGHWHSLPYLKWFPGLVTYLHSPRYATGGAVFPPMINNPLGIFCVYIIITMTIREVCKGV